MSSKKKESLVVQVAKDLNQVITPNIDITLPDDEIIATIGNEIKGGLEFFSTDPLNPSTWKFLKEKWGIDKSKLPKEEKKELAKTEDNPVETDIPSEDIDADTEENAIERTELPDEEDEPVSTKTQKKVGKKKPAKKKTASKKPASKTKTSKPKQSPIDKLAKISSSPKKEKKEKTSSKKEKRSTDWLKSREGGQAAAMNAMLFKGATKKEIVEMLDRDFNVSGTMAPNGKPRSSQAWFGSYLGKLRKKEAAGECRLIIKGDVIKVAKPVVQK